VSAGSTIAAMSKAAAATPLSKHIRAHFTEHQTALEACFAAAETALPLAATLLTECVLSGGKVLACGNGGSATDAQHFAAEMIGRLERERPGLPAIALTADSAVLTAIGNDYAFDAVFARQVHALAQANDVLLILTTSGASPSVLEAIRAAHERDVKVIALTGRDGGQARQLLHAGDVELNVPHARTMRIQEMHRLLLHILCDWVDTSLLGGSDD
jgi:D-sedoheptulose 7-phosphate isomerase